MLVYIFVFRKVDKNEASRLCLWNSFTILDFDSEVCHNFFDREKLQIKFQGLEVQ